MPPVQSESGPGVVVLRARPCLRGMTRRATLYPQARELSLVNVPVTGFTTGYLLPAELTHLRAVDAGKRVTAIACHRNMSPIEREPGLCMGWRDIGAREKSRFPVTGLAPTAVGPAAELASVRIEVAVGTLRKRFHVHALDRRRILSLGDVAERAGDRYMLPAERKTRGAVIEAGKNRRLPALLAVTGAALCTILPGGELLSVGIGMTVYTS